MILPLPPGIERDDTLHGKLYYTRRQMIDYGRLCYDYGHDYGREYKPSPSATLPREAVDNLLSKMGMKK